MANVEKTAGDAADRDSAISRRQFIQSVIATSAVAGVAGLSTSASSVSADALQPAVLNVEQGRALTKVLNCLIPAEGSMPGAGDLGVVLFIDKALAAAPHLRRHFLDVLDALPEAERLEQLPQAELIGLLRHIEGERTESFEMLLEATYAGYYSHPQIQAALGWIDFEQVPEPWEPFDHSLLDQVRRRGSIWERPEIS